MKRGGGVPGEGGLNVLHVWTTGHPAGAGDLSYNIFRHGGLLYEITSDQDKRHHHAVALRYSPFPFILLHIYIYILSHETLMDILYINTRYTFSFFYINYSIEYVDIYCSYFFIFHIFYRKYL